MENSFRELEYFAIVRLNDGKLEWTGLGDFTIEDLQEVRHWLDRPHGMTTFTEKDGPVFDVANFVVNSALLGTTKFSDAPCMATMQIEYKKNPDSHHAVFGLAPLIALVDEQILRLQRAAAV